MRRIATLDLPGRLSPALPPPATEILVALAATAAAVAVRLLSESWTGPIAPYALNFLAVVVACLLAGWRAGLATLLLSQALIWNFVVPPPGQWLSRSAADVLSFALASLSQLFILLVLAFYQREVRAAQAERAQTIDFLGDALREIDHRTRNNFQTVQSLLQLQANRAPSEEAREALREASRRIQAVASVYTMLAVSSEGLEEVRLHEHLRELCRSIEQALLPDRLRLELHLEPVAVPQETAACVGIIVNELVTNAIKHAFPGRDGTIRIGLARRGARLRLEVSDDGIGVGGTAKARHGLGTRLVEIFCKRLGAKHEVRSSDEGTFHAVMIPAA